MPARVNNPRAADQLRREFQIMGDRLNVTLDDVVVPVAVVADLSAGGAIPLVRRCYARFSQAAIALEYGTWRLETPPGIMAIITRILIKSAADGLAIAHFGSTIVAPANLAATQYMDGRLREQLGMEPAARLAYGTQVAVLAAPINYVVARTTPGQENYMEWPFGRDDGYYDFVEFQNHTLNQAISVAMEWDEVQIS